jgi:hypothetical protein
VNSTAQDRRRARNPGNLRRFSPEFGQAGEAISRSCAVELNDCPATHFSPARSNCSTARATSAA